MEKFKEIDRERLITTLNRFGKFDKPDTETYFEIGGGRGAVMIFQKRFTDELNRVVNQMKPLISDEELKLTVGYQVKSLFISGIGWFKIDYDKTFDRYKLRSNKEIPYLYGLPEDSYKFNLVKVEGDKRVSLGEFSTIIKLSLKERFKQWLGKTKPTFTYWI